MIDSIDIRAQPCGCEVVIEDIGTKRSLWPRSQLGWATVSALITPQLVDVVDTRHARRTFSSGASQPLTDCHLYSWGLSLECETPEDPLYDAEITWLLPGPGLRLTQRHPRSKHARPGPSLLTAVRITRDSRHWRTTDLLLGIEVEAGLPSRIVGAEDFAAATYGGMLRPGEVDFALWGVHRTLNELTHHRHDLSAWLAFQGIYAPWRE